ncbi:50S ribosomal protein L18e [Methanoplanus endosymbiosus]|uniref:Large ribosomal subunit protein eL18 n=1 Tax=Methanoplanus endosymbiosus TaxID=33865 RepID=A0A9E7PQB7_9EURY|nr:50S ribosomal protein L18e [Methanoplanus endosymbiosus]UUX93452.1 50S ribosomal protein L18e [Methanoplanus endosymbiosus]
MKIATKTNPRYSALVATLKDASRTNDAGVWREIAKRLEAPSRNHAEVNLNKISRYAREGETVIVPGKVLGSGVLSSGVTVAALNFSESAIDKIKNANGTCMTIEDLVKSNPEGKSVRILR